MSTETIEELKKKQPHIVVGDYILWEFDDGKLAITHRVTGEVGVFEKEDFLPYVSSFFGLNF